MNAVAPSPLRRGDTVAIVSPASIIDPKLVDGAVDTLGQLGFNPRVMPHALGRRGSYSGSIDERLSDLTEALADPSVRAILCSRGGYGAVHLLEQIAPAVPRDPKWLIGFSDISVLHAMWYAAGIMSIHGSMAKQLAAGPDTEPTRRLLALLAGDRPELSWPATHMAPNRPGSVTAPLTGGNLAVLDALVGTPYNSLRPGNILFIEDIAEPVYKIERMLYHLKLAGILPRLAGLVVGRFTEYAPDRNFESMEAMIARMVDGYDFPVAFNAPVGHIGAENMPLLHGAATTLVVTGDCCVLK